MAFNFSYRLQRSQDGGGHQPQRHKEFWEDIEDVLVSQSRRHEKRIPFERVRADLIKSGKLRG